METDSPEILTLEYVAKSLRCTREHARQLCISGRLPYINIGAGERKNYRILREDYNAFVKSQRRQVADEQFNRQRHFTGVKKYV